MLSTTVLIGIAAGSIVFVGTILTVFFLLHHGGSFDRMRQEAIGLPASMGERKPQLYDELLERAKSMPLKPAVLISPLVGETITIRNFVPSDQANRLHMISNGGLQDGIYRSVSYDANEMIWRHMDHGPFETVKDFLDLHCSDLADSRHFVIVDNKSDALIGMLTLCNHSPRNLRIEIGHVWLTPSFQGSGAFAEAMMLMLRHLFDLKYRRVEWCCDGYNVRARRAAHSLGLSFEGVRCKHKIVKGCNRDTVMFAALNNNWPVIEDQLRRRVEQSIINKSQREVENKNK